MIILAMTTDNTIVDQLKTAGQVMKSNSLEHAKTLIQGGEIDAVVVAEPFANINIELLEHSHVVVIRNKNDLNKFLKKSKPTITDTFFDGIVDETEKKPARKVRPIEEEPQKVELKGLGTVLLVTTNYELIKYLAEFNLRIATTRHTAIKSMDCEPKIVIWDIEAEPFERPGALVYRWGHDLLHLEDVTQVLANLDITLQ